MYIHSKSIVRILVFVGLIIVPLAIVAQEPAKPTKATYLITGLHCPPCTRTVEDSLRRLKGVKAISVDWRTHNAKVEFDEGVLPAQVLARSIAGTPHMMGRGMEYAGWLALKVPSLTDDASGRKVKEVLAKVEGIQGVAVYPAQHAVGVRFGTEGKLTSQEVIDALTNSGVEASNF